MERRRRPAERRRLHLPGRRIIAHIVIGPGPSRSQLKEKGLAVAKVHQP
jgi:hypothetical protein